MIPNKRCIKKHKTETHELEYEDTENLENITSEDEEAPRRKHSDFVGGVRTGIVVPYSPVQPINAYGFMGFDGRLETDFYFVEFGSGFAVLVPISKNQPNSVHNFSTNQKITSQIYKN